MRYTITATIIAVALSVAGLFAVLATRNLLRDKPHYTTIEGIGAQRCQLDSLRETLLIEQNSVAVWCETGITRHWAAS